jgi:glycerol uptake facilitator-like aquaporin
MWPALRSEFLATFGLVLLGTGACVLEGATRGLGAWGVGAAWGLAVLLMAKVHAAQMNPAASLALSLLGRQEWRVSALCAAAQCAGALAASLLLKVLAGPHGGDLGATLPHAGVPAAFAAEALMTFVLLAAALRAAPARAPYVAGAVVALEAAFGGAVSGASMNPARSLAPAIASGVHDGLWIYLAAPALGAAAAALLLRHPARALTEARS